MEISRGTYITAGASLAAGAAGATIGWRDTLKAAQEPDAFKIIFGKGGRDGYGHAKLTPADFHAARQWAVGLGLGAAVVTATLGYMMTSASS